MSRSPAPAPSDHPEPANHFRRRWLGAADEKDEPAVGWEVDLDDEWKWPPCPDGDRQRLSGPLGFRERNIGELELRVLLGDSDDGVCQIIADEHDDEVHVRVLVHAHNEHKGLRPARRGYVDCPVRLWLERPLGDRAVIDMDTDEELPLYTPLYLDNELQPDHGYRPTQRRRSMKGP